ncbi:Bromo-adjacent domain-containing protein [Cinnamomum micranthum f. kanehirae]|uniref:Bromo-adjacent domain-containing protein n=1 Tax=Cinnamomum micranthum f. kanehirae TaxID=337451 RepID=A0A3S3NPI4_9MAGN|nr:Bromo-adjacent domain-containing protein [Cinnamomum micranthum f. kanehirae]
MGLDTVSERRNCCKDRKIPKVVSTSNRLGSKVQKNDDKGKPTQRNYVVKNQKGDFSRSGTSNFLSPRKSMPSSLSRVTGNEELKRGSIYQSSESVRQMKKLGVLKGTRKIQSLRNSDSSLTFTIIDSLSRPNLKEVSPVTRKNGSILVSSKSCKISTSVGMNYIPPSSSELLHRPFRRPEDHSNAQSSSEGFLEICLDSKDVAGEPKLKCDRTSAPENDSNCLAEKDTLLKFSKSASVRVVMPEPSCQLESDPSKENSTAQISPLRKILHPTLKSKSLRNPSVTVAEPNGPTTIGSEGVKKNKTLRKSLLQDFSKIAHKAQCSEQLTKTEVSPVRTSPVHLHGLLRLESKHGMPFFELSLNDREDVLVAKTWRTDNAFNWVYTFYSISCKRKSNSSGWGPKVRNRESSMVGQMQASCYLCSEVRNAGSLDNSTVMEFVLYDTAHARKSVATQDQLTKDDGNSNLSAPWVSVNLHPHLEVAAIVVQVPFENKESLEGKIGNKVADAIPSSTVAANVKVITASGTHGLPNSDGGVPSPLLKRWRSSGGCDCGGWDMACPVAVFDNSSARDVADSSFIATQWPLQLFAQGAKEEVPALTMTFIEEGQYSVDFHAQLSTLQAFAICVALMNNREVSIAVGQESYSHSLHCKSLKSLLQEEVRILVEAVAEEEKRNVVRRKEGNLPYLAFKPPFSPIGRV